MRQASTPAPRRGAFSFAGHARVPGPCSCWAGIATLLGLIWSCTLFAGDITTMTEIRYEEKESDQPVYRNRILIFGERLRMDYGQDDEDFILYDRRENIAWHVAREGRRLVGINASPVRYAWPKTWKLAQEQFASGANRLTRVHVNEHLCVEFKSAPILKEEARLLRDFRRALAGNQSSTWSATPEELRHPCNLAIDVKEAGIEYRQGLPLAIRYWDGRSRVYQSHQAREAKPELFELPADYRRFMLGERQGKANARQPAPSQRK